MDVPKCVTIGCDSEATHQDKNNSSRTFCSRQCAQSHQQMLSGQITQDHNLYRMISSYYNSLYEENKDYTLEEFDILCHDMAQLLKRRYEGAFQIVMSDLTHTSLRNALMDTYKSDKQDRANLIKTIIGSFMNFVMNMKRAMTTWQQKNTPYSTILLLLSLFQWMTHEQGIKEIKRWMPNEASPPIVLFRAVTRMSDADPYVTMANVDYSSTLILMFPRNEDDQARRARVLREGGEPLTYNTYAVRSFGSDSELADFSFLTKAKELGAQKVLVSHDNQLKMLDLEELYQIAAHKIIDTPRYVPWSG